MHTLSDFELWLGEYLENPQAPEADTWRVFAAMCNSGNIHALEYYDRMQREWRRDAIARGEVIDPDLPLNTVGSNDAPDTMVTTALSDGQAEYSENWSSIATSLKDTRSWRCEVCAFQFRGSGLIQVHHIDGDKADNKAANLQVLCAICHGEKHRNPPVWPGGVLESDKMKLIDHHRSRSRTFGGRG